jgi:anti-anti-sigma factor
VTQEARFDVRGVDPPARLVVTGEVDIANAEQLGAALTEALLDHPSLVVDMTEMDFLGMAGIATLHRYTERLDAVLVRRGSSVARVLGLVRFPGLVAVGGRSVASATIG